MNQYLKNLLSVTEVLITKELEQENYLKLYKDSDYFPVYEIYDSDLIDCRMSYSSFGATLHELEKKNYIEISGIHGRKNETELPLNTDTQGKIIASHRERQPDVRFNVFVKGNIWRLNKAILKEEDIEKISIGTTIYFPDEHILGVHDHKVHIKLKNDAPNEHYILYHMMKEGFHQEYFYSEMIEEKILDTNKEWRSYYDACLNLNEKVEKKTSGIIKQLLLVRAGETGSVRLNPKYL